MVSLHLQVVQNGTQFLPCTKLKRNIQKATPLKIPIIQLDFHLKNMLIEYHPALFFFCIQKKTP